MDKNYYEILNLSRDASLKEIKSSYRKLASQYHPDVNNDKKAQEIFIKIREAYDVLSNPVKKEDYDNKLNYAELLRDTRRVVPSNHRPKWHQYSPYRTHRQQYNYKNIPQNQEFLIQNKKTFVTINWIIIIIGALLLSDFLTIEPGDKFYFNAFEVREVPSKGMIYNIEVGSYLKRVGPFKELSESEPAQLFKTKLFGKRKGYELYSIDGTANFVSDPAPIYGTLIFFPAITILLSIIGLFIKKHPVTFANLSIISILFAIFTLVIFLLS
ncbi:J domain-containing protein [Mangrovivirga halotolerans]|uniref:J domain-containing protein n=1 Tax=Mangrovivirga halotolerans TaxID=2993936 RepID=UPI00272DCEE4|nr:DnaJ domain-containing protein [Mangrovivirga halotolerans]